MPLVTLRNQSVRWLFAELFVIVLGISIAFQVEEWRNQLAEKRTERRVLLSMLSDFEIAKEQFQIYLDLVNEQADTAQAYREYLRADSQRAEQDMVALVEQFGGYYLWQATDATFSSINPAIISDGELRSRLIRFHDGFMPFMLNISLRLQQAQSEFRDVLWDDYERIVDFNERTTVIRPITSLDRIPTNGDFFKQLDDYTIALTPLIVRIPEAIEQIETNMADIETHLQQL